MPRFKVEATYRWDARDIDNNPLGYDEESTSSLHGYYRNERAAIKALVTSEPWPKRAKLIPETVRVSLIDPPTGF